MHDLGHADEGVEVEEDGEWVEDVGEDHPGRLSEHLDLILLRFRILQQETERNTATTEHYGYGLDGRDWSTDFRHFHTSENGID